MDDPKPSDKQFSGFLDLVKGGRVEGWAYDSKRPNQFVLLELFVDGSPVRVFEANTYRSDLEEVGKGFGHVAFYQPLPRKYLDGLPHKVELRYLETGGLLEGSPITVPFDKAGISEIRGFQDTTNSREVAGWVMDTHFPDEPVNVELLADDVIVSQTTADRKRIDLIEANIGNGRCGFTFTMPPSLLDDVERVISVRVQGTNLVVPGASPFKGRIHRPYKTFSEYLNWALYFHEMHQPFEENDKTVIATMIALNRHYQSLALNFPADDLISIIMPTYNRSRIIREAINSVRSQLYTNWELIIVDDASSDDTSAIVTSYNDERITYLKNETNVGPSAARARGVHMSKGSYFAYLDSDNKWDPAYLSIMLYFLRSQPFASSAYCAQLVTYVGHSNYIKKAVRFAPFARSIVENVNYIDLNCFVHDRTILEKAGTFRTDLRMLEDWDLILRYTEESNPAALPCLLSHYFSGHSSSQVTAAGDFNSTVEAIHGLDFPDMSIDFESAFQDFSKATQLRRSLYPNKGPKRAPATARFVSIIIPSYEAGNYLDICIESIISHTPRDYFEIVVIDNASVGSALSVLEKYKRLPMVRVIQNSENFGYTRAINQGIEAARPNSDIIFFNNDALVTDGWLEALWEVRGHVHDVAMIVPRQTLLARTDTMEKHVPNCNSSLEVDVNLSAHHQNVLDPFFDRERGFMELSFAAFFCVYVTRECIDEVSELDHVNGRHYRSDATYCNLSRFILKKRIIYTPHSKLYHFLQQSTAQLRGAQPSLYNEIFVRNTWSTDDPFGSIFSS